MADQKSKAKLHTILVVDDDKSVIDSFDVMLSDNYNIVSANTGEDALDLIQEQSVDLILLDIRLPGIDGMEVLKQIKELDPQIEIIMITAVKTVKNAVQAIKLGACDYIVKPFDIHEVKHVISKTLRKRQLEREVGYLRTEARKPAGRDLLIGQSFKMRKIYDLIDNMAKTEATVVIYGESGTGKELVARAIHYNGPRADKPFVTVDCATIPGTLIESELFGHEKGAFTGATGQKLGRFEIGNSGTIFLDEIGNLGPDVQAKLLRVIQEREIQRVGGRRPIKIDVKIIAATNIDLKEAIKLGNFREDLFYRINVVPINLPTLRERKEDIPLLIHYFLNQYNKKFNRTISGFTDQALKYLVSYRWPGNIRELQNIIERLVALEKEDLITHRSLPFDILVAVEERIDGSLPEIISYKAAKREFEREFLLGVLEKLKWNQSKAADLLGIHRNTLIIKFKNLGIMTPKQKRRKRSKPFLPEVHNA